MCIRDRYNAHNAGEVLEAELSRIKYRNILYEFTKQHRFLYVAMNKWVFFNDFNTQWYSYVMVLLNKLYSYV